MTTIPQPPLEILIQQAVAAGVAQALAQLNLGGPKHIKLGYTIAEAVEVSGCTDWELRTAIRRGELHAHRSGASKEGKHVIHHAHLDAWLRGVPQNKGKVG